MMYDILDDKTMDFLRDRFGIIGESELMREVILKLLKVAPTDLTVLITGETGVTGALLGAPSDPIVRSEFNPSTLFAFGIIVFVVSK